MKLLWWVVFHSRSKNFAFGVPLITAEATEPVWTTPRAVATTPAPEAIESYCAPIAISVAPQGRLGVWLFRRFGAYRQFHLAGTLYHRCNATRLIHPGEQ